MDKREFILPGAILGIVVIVGIGLLLTYENQPAPLDTNGIATSTVSSTTLPVSTTTPTAPVGGRPAPRPGTYTPYGPVTLPLNKAAGFADGLSLRPISIVEDSRCPQDVECIQAGTVRVSLRTTVAGKSETRTLALGEKLTRNGTTITFTGAAPARTTSSAPAASSYRLTFSVVRGNTVAGPCYVGGCSGQICSDRKDTVSTCEYRSEYACYRTARCERQASGACGWTPTAELTSCLANPPGL
jgi:hypothetical protein